MKALIMEDEVPIREGICGGIDWEQYGITEVYTAQNGETGLVLAKKHRPQIILADIRMPRLDGISAVKRLRKIIPECSIIFVSAYPEKDYFKEAIRLKAVSFVEKPVCMSELQKVLAEAVREQKQHLASQTQKEKALMFRSQELVGRLCRNRFDSREELWAELEEMGISASRFGFFAAVLLLYTDGDREDRQMWELFCMENQQRARKAPITLLCGQKQENCVVYHLFMEKEEDYETAVQWLRDQMEGISRYYILCGNLKKRVSRLQDSYQEAVLMENRAFFAPYGQVIRGEEEELVMNFDFGSWMAEFTELLSAGKYEELQERLSMYREHILSSRKLHYIGVRKFYLYLYGELERHMQKHTILAEGERRGGAVQELLLGGCNYLELHDSVAGLLGRMQDGLEQGQEREEEVIVRVKQYIYENYGNPWLSIKEIADSAGKSVSHLCVVFKKETGITLNQYMTDIRMENACILLQNPRNSIRTVAEKSGYTDSSYFSRIFKKHTGKTPSEYRGEEL